MPACVPGNSVAFFDGRDIEIEIAEVLNVLTGAVFRGDFDGRGAVPESLPMGSVKRAGRLQQLSRDDRAGITGAVVMGSRGDYPKMAILIRLEGNGDGQWVSDCGGNVPSISGNG